MVEKWLLEVEETMVLSIRDVINQSVNAYATTPRKQWVIEWPGQVAICVSCIYWTSEVTDAMAVPQGMQVRSVSTLRVLFLIALGGLLYRHYSSSDRPRPDLAVFRLFC